MRVVTTETLPVVVPLEPTTPIRPSEAIRLGCLLRPVQWFDDLSDPNRPDVTACAVEAMWVGYGGYSGGGAYLDAIDSTTSLGCPDHGVVFDLISHLNDDHRWSRERIADWLTGLGL